MVSAASRFEDDDSGRMITDNNVSGLRPAGTEAYQDAPPGFGLSQSYLDPYTNHNLVVCARRWASSVVM